MHRDVTQKNRGGFSVFGMILRRIEQERTDTLAAISKDILSWHRKVSRMAIDKDISGALAMIREGARESGLSSYLPAVEDILENYRLILEFFARGTRDDQRNELHISVIRKVLELSDRLREEAMLKASSDPVTLHKKAWLPNRKPYGAEAVSWAEGLTQGSELDQILDDIQLESTQLDLDRQVWLDQLFNLAWLPDKLQDEEAQALGKVISDERVPTYARALLTSGLSLGLVRSFDKFRFQTLLPLCSDAETETRVRALSGLLFGLFLHHKRLPYYPALQQAISTALDISIVPQEVEAILLQWVRSQDTAAIAKTLREELLPGMMRITPRITERLKLDDILPGEGSSDKNPDWEMVFGEDPELLDKLQQLTERHLAGDDVFMSVFAQQKHYPFFQEVANWLIPFHLEAPVVQEIIHRHENDDVLVRLIREMESTHMLSHSDKYSFILNLGFLNDMQKELLKATFSAEMEEYRNHMAESESLEPLNRFKNALKMYMQDLYRFHQLHPHRRWIPDVFKLPLEGVDIGMMGPYLRRHNIDYALAQFHFDREHWAQAAYALSRLAEQAIPTHIIFEKAGYAFQQVQEYERALDYYRKAELFDTNRDWLLKRMAYCYRKSGRPEHALRIYEEHLRDHPGDLRTLVQAANVLLESKDYAGALIKYQEAELLDSDNVRLLRPLAWCYLQTLEAGRALQCLQRIPEEARDYHDYMNAGHASWILGNTPEASSFYRRGYQLHPDTAEDFLKGYQEDRPLLHRAGIASAETAMMADLLRELPGSV